jgi:predicted transcriptional regulator
MATITLDDDLAQQLEALAQRENRPVSEVVRDMIRHYEAKHSNVAPASEEAYQDAVDALIGAFDDDVTDMSVTVRETMATLHGKKDASDSH